MMKTEETTSDKVLNFILGLSVGMLIIAFIGLVSMFLINTIALMFNPAWTLLTVSQTTILLFSLWFSRLIWQLINMVVPD